MWILTSDPSLVCTWSNNNNLPILTPVQSFKRTRLFPSMHIRTTVKVISNSWPRGWCSRCQCRPDSPYLRRLIYTITPTWAHINVWNHWRAVTLAFIFTHVACMLVLTFTCVYRNIFIYFIPVGWLITQPPLRAQLLACLQRPNLAAFQVGCSGRAAEVQQWCSSWLAADVQLRYSWGAALVQLRYSWRA